MIEHNEWENLSLAEKKLTLYLNQRRLLEIFLSKNAITKEQYEKSLCDLTEKMGMKEYNYCSESEL